jgi:cytochrome c oxidase cbb3-type subunit 3
MNKKHDNNQQNEPKVTGHVWDDNIQEYDTPAPRWWLIVWVVCIIWGVVYWFFYPTWPTPGGNNKGINNWTSKSQLKESQIEINNRKAKNLEKFSKLSFEEIKKDKELIEFALAGGKIAFKENCAACHGTGAAGAKGYPNLNDDDWLWGGSIQDIYQTLKYGIRSDHEDARDSAMPAFGLDELLSQEEIDAVAGYVMSLSDIGKANSKGEAIFKEQCAVCHGDSGKGDRSVGAPNLADKIWLYGKSKEDIIYTIYNARAGVMPNWNERLDDNTIRQLAIYIHLLGGGE